IAPSSSATSAISGTYSGDARMRSTSAASASDWNAAATTARIAEWSAGVSGRTTTVLARAVTLGLWLHGRSDWTEVSAGRPTPPPMPLLEARYPRRHERRTNGGRRARAVRVHPRQLHTLRPDLRGDPRRHA